MTSRLPIRQIDFISKKSTLHPMRQHLTPHVRLESNILTHFACKPQLKSKHNKRRYSRFSLNRGENLLHFTSVSYKILHVSVSLRIQSTSLPPSLSSLSFSFTFSRSLLLSPLLSRSCLGFTQVAWWISHTYMHIQEHKVSCMNIKSIQKFALFSVFS